MPPHSFTKSKTFKQKRKGGLTLGINCSREVPSSLASEASESRVDNINSINHGFSKHYSHVFAK